MRLRRVIGIAIISGLLCGRPVVANAAERRICPVCHRVTNEPAPSSETTPYSAKAGSTLARGATNTLLGWTDLIREPAAEAKQGGNVLVGLGKGLGGTVKRTFGGLADVLTFWTPKTRTGYLHFTDDCPVCAGKH